MTLPKLNMIDVKKLEAASMVLAIPDWHTKKAYARNETENQVSSSSLSACKFCLAGALDAVDFKHTKILGILADTYKDLFGVDLYTLVEFNDKLETTNVEVSELLWCTAQRVRAFVNKPKPVL